MPSQTITSTASGVTLTPADYSNPVTVVLAAVVSGPQYGIYAATDWSILNLGTVTSTGAVGVSLHSGGTLVNGQSGSTIAAAYISGPEAVSIQGAAGIVANYGTIAGTFDGIVLLQGGTVTNGASGATAARITGANGIFISNVAGTVDNDGSIIGTGNFDGGAILSAGGRVVNGAAAPTTSTALISATGNAANAVWIHGGTGTAINYGTLSAVHGTALQVDNGGTVVNGVSGANVALISGDSGIAAAIASLSITNYGIVSVASTGVLLNAGGSIDNAQSSAAILGGNDGIDISNGGTVRNLGTIAGTTANGIYLLTGGDVTNGQSDITISAALISGGYYGIRNSGSGTVTNFGTVLGSKYAAVQIQGPGSVANSGIIRDDTTNSFARAIRLQTGGNVSNAASGTIVGDGAGVYIAGGTGTVSNAGSIIGVNSNGAAGIAFSAGGSVANIATGASITGAAVGVDIYGAAGTVTNLGTIAGLPPFAGGLSSSEGVQLRQAGSVDNGVSGSTFGLIYGFAVGVNIYGPSAGGLSFGKGTVTNHGTIIGRSNTGVNLQDGGSVTNGDSGASAYIYGGAEGVVTDFANFGAAPNELGTVVNFGTIVGGSTSGAGVALRSGGTLVNQAGATITGGYGVSAVGPGGVGLTVVNAGTIIGTGPNHFAVFFQSANNRLVDVPGAVFDGTVVAAGTATLELASAATTGTISGIGSAFTNFDTITADANAQWTISGANTVTAGLAIDIGSGADVEVAGTVTGGLGVALGGGTIGFAGAVDGGDAFDFAGTGGLLPSKLALGTTNGTGFANTITGFGGHDAIFVNDVTFAAGSTPVYSAGTLTVDLAGGGSFSFSNFAFEGGVPTPIQVTDHSLLDTACFAAGTQILTDRGAIAVEALQPGDRVVTLDGTLRPVRWIGHRRIDLTRHPDPRRVQPIRIRRDAVADGMPGVDVFVSPDHAIYLDGALVPVRRLLNGMTIVQETGRRAVHYFHVELDQHAILFADGLPAESYLDTGNRGMFENAPEPLVLHPDLAACDGQRRRVAGSCLPLVEDVGRAASLWRPLAERARALGHRLPVLETTDDPALRLLVHGVSLAPMAIDGEWQVFAVPRGAGEACLISRATAPCDITPWVEDRRQLGIMLRQLTLHRESGCETVPLDHPMLRGGWWAMEQGWRWSDGNACLALPDDATMLEIAFGTTTYRVDAAAPHRAA